MNSFTTGFAIYNESVKKINFFNNILIDKSIHQPEIINDSSTEYINVANQFKLKFGIPVKGSFVYITIDGRIQTVDTIDYLGRLNISARSNSNYDVIEFYELLLNTLSNAGTSKIDLHM